MIARLILSLLLAAFALPAMATVPCHDDRAPTMMAMTVPAHHSMPAAPLAPDDRTMVHACIGCIPPSSLRTGPAAAPMLKTIEIRVATAVHFDPGKAPAPVTPPPRIGA
jgi:hypothetical protein